MSIQDTNTKQRWSTRKPMTIGLIAMLILLGGFGAWSVFAQITGAVITSGQIEVDRNRQVIQHQDGGIVEEIIVDEGDLVEAGDLLIRLDASILTSELAVVEGQLFEILARRGRLEAERDGLDEIVFDPILFEGGSDVEELMRGQERLFAARKDTALRSKEQLQQQQAQIESQLEGIEAQRQALTSQQEIVEKELAEQIRLRSSGLTPEARVTALQREAAEILGRLGELSSSNAQALERMTEIEIQILGLATTQREEAITQLRDLQFNQLDLTEQRRTLKLRLDRLDIRSPVSGIVYGLTVFAPKSVIRAADPVMFLVPQDRPLVIATQVQPTDIDQIYVGQDVTLRFSAFDQRTTPELKGVVTLISADSFQDDSNSLPYYRAEVEMAEGEAERLPENVTLIPGMPVEAFVRTQVRSPLNYLVKPLSDYFAKAFRES